ncbi:MAG: TIGR03667 family PPOX class F420-dependent oxidoreductase [Chloroflexi bacterium]|nr:TIGR03667 family PPOX class F420-dependent oxidoreductase [Chloroflexota bacterium]
MVDFSSELGKQTLGRLENEAVIWLTTVTPSGTPQPRPVWFIWKDNKVIVYSKPHSKKIAHLKNNPNVALNFNMQSAEDDFQVLIGSAVIDSSPVPVLEEKEYMTKYADGIRNIDMTPQSFSQAYNVRIEITPTRLRGL